MKISIFGGGSWGTTLASLLAGNNKDSEVVLWAREEEVRESIEKDRENRKFLPGVKLSDNLKVTNDIREAAENSDILVNAIPSQFARETAKKYSKHLKEGITIVTVSKGLENHTFKRISEVLKEEIPNIKIAVLSGPNHAEEVSRKIPAATVIASTEADC